MYFIVILASLLIALATFFLITGKNIKLRTRMVRLKDEEVETRNKAVKSRQDRVVTVVGGVIVAGLAYAISGVWYYGTAGLFSGVFVFNWWKRKQETERMELLRSQFIDVLGQLESAMYGGLNPYQALEDSVPNMPRPAKDVFYEILRRVRTGDTLVRAIDIVRKDVGWEDLKVLSIGISLYNRVGCDLGEICRHAMDSQEDRESFRSVVAASVAQNIMTLKVLTVLPFLFVGLARVMAPDFAHPLFYTLEGTLVFIAATLWIVMGNYYTRRMIKNTLEQGA